MRRGKSDDVSKIRGAANSSQEAHIPQLSEQILELRYKANPRVLDNRGAWASEISKQMGLLHWRIGKDRLDVYDVRQKERLFVSHYNAGCVFKDAPTNHFFSDKAQKFLHILFNFKDFTEDLFITRVGVRLKTCLEFQGSFEELVRKYQENYAGMTTLANVLNASIKDIAISTDFQDAIGHFNTQTGPMKADQLREFLNRESGMESPDAEHAEINYPDVGIFVDVDYWTKPERTMPLKELIRIVQEFNNACWRRQNEINNLVLTPHVEKPVKETT